LFARRDWATAFVGPSEDSAAEEATFLDTAAQVLPQAVETIMDKIVQRRKDNR
jgi:hypothetical protein